jgi:outer membrane protein W
MMMTASAACVLAALAIAQASAPALAGDLANAPALESAPPPVAEPFDPFLVRLKGVYVSPDGTGKIASTFPVFPLTALIGADVNVGTEFIPVVEASYFFTKNFAVQAVCCVSYAALSIPRAGGVVGHAWALPETVFAQYPFTSNLISASASITLTSLTSRRTVCCRTLCTSRIVGASPARSVSIT